MSRFVEVCFVVGAIIAGVRGNEHAFLAFLVLAIYVRVSQPRKSP